MSALARLAPAAVAATYFLIVVGAVVRVTGSGMGCLDDWPLCQGQLLPPAEFTAIVEWTHRLIGAIVSPLILTVCVVALLRARQVAALRWPALLVPLLLVTQIVLGAIVVRLELAAMVVMVHLGFAMVIFGLLAWMAVWSQRAPSVLPARDGEPSEPVVPRSVVRLIWVTTLLAFVLVISGALVRATGATWACVGFPTCNGEALPFGTSTLVDIHLLHRLLAYSVAWLVGLTVYQVGKRARRAPALFRTAVHAGGFVLLQVAFGAIAVTFGVTPVIQALHVAGASAVWGSMVVLAALVTRVQNATTNAASTQNLAETR